MALVPPEPAEPRSSDSVRRRAEIASPGRYRLAVARATAAVTARAASIRGTFLSSRNAQVATKVLLYLLPLAIITYVFAILNREFFLISVGYDESFFVWGGWSIRKGLVPYRDFLEFKPPMVFITHALAQALFGMKNNGFRWFFALFPLSSLLALHVALTARGVGRFLSMAAVLAIVALFVNGAFHDTALTDSESIGLSYYMLGLALSLWEGRFVKMTTALGGFSFACCVLSKEPFLPTVALTCVGLFWLRGQGHPTRESTVLYLKYTSIGVAGFAVLLMGYMIPTGALRAYLKTAGGYARMYRDPLQSYCVVLGRFRSTTFFGNLKTEWTNIRSVFMNEGVLGYLLPFLVTSAVFIFNRSRALSAIVLGAFVASLWATTASNCMWNHYYNMAMAGVIFVVIVGLDSTRSALERSPRLLRFAVSVAALLLVVGHAADDFLYHRSAPYSRGHWLEPQAGLAAFIAKETKPTDTIFTDGPPILYVETNRLSATRESNYTDEIMAAYDGKTDEEKLRPIYDSLVKRRPKVVFLDPESGPRKVRHRNAAILPFLRNYHYKEINPSLFVRPD